MIVEPRERLHRALEERRAAMIATLATLVRIPSVNGRDPERAIAEAVAAELDARGIEAKLPAFAPERPCVIASVGEGPTTLALVAHLDTVAIGARESWRHDPLGAVVADGRLYGRGACDNKGGIAIGIELLAAWRDLVPPDAGRLLLCCVPDEESGATGRLGITPLLARGLLRADAAIYTYPGLDTISIGHRGLLRLRITAHGEAAHSGSLEWERGEAGANAVTAMAALLVDLEDWLPEGGPHPAFPGRRAVVTPGTTISGGSMASMVPDRCEALVDLRLLPGQTAEELRAEVELRAALVAAPRRGIRFEVETIVSLPAVAIPADHPLVVACARWTERLAGITPRREGAGPANEGYLLIGAGIPTICGFGPPGGNAHAADEYVELDGLVLAAQIYGSAALDFFEGTP